MSRIYTLEKIEELTKAAELSWGSNSHRAKRFVPRLAEMIHFLLEVVKADGKVTTADTVEQEAEKRRIGKVNKSLSEQLLRASQCLRQRDEQYQALLLDKRNLEARERENLALVCKEFGIHAASIREVFKLARERSEDERATLVGNSERLQARLTKASKQLDETRSELYDAKQLNDRIDYESGCARDLVAAGLAIDDANLKSLSATTLRLFDDALEMRKQMIEKARDRGEHLRRLTDCPLCINLDLHLAQLKLEKERRENG